MTTSTRAPGELLDDDVKANYRALRLERGQSWSELAAQFRRDAAGVPAARGRGYVQLAEWAEHEAATNAEQPARRGRRSRSAAVPTRPDQTTAQPAPAETATPTGPQQDA